MSNASSPRAHASRACFQSTALLFALALPVTASAQADDVADQGRAIAPPEGTVHATEHETPLAHDEIDGAQTSESALDSASDDGNVDDLSVDEFDIDLDEFTLDRIIFVDPPSNFDRFDLERARAADSVDTRDAQERGARTLDEAVTALTPFQALPSTGASPGPLLVDGLDGAWVQVLIDGIPFTRTTTTRNGPVVDLAAVSVDPSRIERIDIYRGGSPAGSCGASGLVLNLITKTPEHTVTGSVTLDGGVTIGGISRFGVRGDLAIPLTEDWSLRVNGGFQRTQEVDVTDDGTYDRPRRNLGDGELQARWRPNGEDRLTLNARTYHTYARTIANPRMELEDRTQSRNYAFDVQYRNASDNTDRFTLRTSVQYLDHRFYKHVRSSGYDRLKAETDALTLRATGTWNRTFGDHDVSVELCSTGDIVSRRGESGETPTIQEAQFCVGAYDTWRLSDVVTLEGQVLGGYHTKLGARWTAGLAAVTRLNAAHGLRFSFDAAQRLPTVEERYLQFDHSELGYFLTGNEDLETEQAFSLRGGWVYDIIPNMLGLEMTAFFTALNNRIEGIIKEAQNPPTTPVAIFSYANRGRGNSFGIDTVLRGHQINDWFNFDLSYNFLPLAKDPNTGADLHMRSHHSARLSLRASLLQQRLTLWTSAGLRSRILWTEGDPDGPPQEPSFLWDMGISGTPHDNVWLSLTARNLVNDINPTWGPMPGFEVLFTAQFTLQGRERN